MNIQKPTERVAPTTHSDKGFQSVRRYNNDPYKLGLNVAAAEDESNSSAGEGGDIFVRNPGSGRLDKDTYNRLRDTLLAEFCRQLTQRWGTRLSRPVSRLLRVLLKHGEFARGRRVAFPLRRLAAACDVDERTVQRWISALLGHYRTRPGAPSKPDATDLLQPVHLQPGQLAWDERPSRVTHVEWELGPTLLVLARSIAEPASSSARDDTMSPPSRRRVVPAHDTTPPDPLWIPIDQESLAKSPLATTPTTPNLKRAPRKIMEKPTPFLSRHQKKFQPAAARNQPPTTQQQATSPEKQQGPRVTLGPEPPELPPTLRPLAKAVIRQHREIAEPSKGPGVGFEPREMDLVGAALSRLDTCSSESEIMRVCARVSALALQESSRNGNNRATLGFAFGGVDDEPNKHFFRRVCELRESEKISEKERHDAERVAALFGRQPPSPRPRNPLVPSPPPRATQSATRRNARPRKKSGPPLSAREMTELLSQSGWLDSHRVA